MKSEDKALYLIAEELKFIRELMEIKMVKDGYMRREK
jgi:hypothetical protein